MKVGFINAFFLLSTDHFPIGLVSLCTILKKNNINSEIIDFNIVNQSNTILNDDFSEVSITTFGDYILKKEFDIISFYTMANSYHISILIANYIKSKATNITIIFAGPQATVCAEDTLNAFPFVDLISLGEGELTICNIIESISNKSYQSCPSIVYRQQNTIVSNRIFPLIENLDDLPYLDYSFVPYIKNTSVMPIEVGRGCPFSCSFCSTKNFWQRQYRLKSSERIISEIKYIKQNMNIDEFNFEHDSLTANRKTIISFCEDLIKNNLNIIWRCSSRIDILDEELISILKSAGCYKIFMGIETGSPRMQKIINKNLHFENFWNTVSLLQKYNIESIFSFIYGFPNETPNDLSLTLDVISELMKMKVKHIQIHKLCILRGTEFYDKYKINLLKIDEQLTSNFNLGGNASNFKSIIIDYPSIFPQYYKLNNTIEKTEYLEIFVNVFLDILHINYPYTFKYLSKYFNKNMFSLYLDLYNDYDQLENSYNQYNKKKIFKTELFKIFSQILDNYLHHGRFEQDIVSQTIYKFEEDYIEWSYTTNTICEREYKINIYQCIIDDIDLSKLENIFYPIRLQFYKKDSKYFIKRL